MTRIEVVHLKREPHCHAVDRRTWLGNPFHLNSESDRAAVVAAHKLYLWMLVNPNALPMEPVDVVHFLLLRDHTLTLSSTWQRPKRTEFMQAISMLHKAAHEQECLQLGCWCAPKACHADNLKSYLEWSNGLRH
jgi:hypothetical protein